MSAAQRLARSIRKESHRWQESSFNGGERAVTGPWLLTIIGLSRDDNVHVIDARNIGARHISIRLPGGDDVACHWFDRWALISAMAAWRRAREQVARRSAEASIQ